MPLLRISSVSACALSSVVGVVIDLKLHDLRHTFASALIEEGQSIKYVQTVMGHASAKTTLDVYGHLFEAGGQDAARRLEAYLLADSGEHARQAV